MAVKFPLEMKEGVQVRTLSELKANFDIEKVVGYYFDGKLKKWLDARWYEEESEEVGKLKENDPFLAKHLCEIFGINYADDVIDTEEIVLKNERIAKLKQYTDDEEIIKKVDSVAFNQEELADLYEKGVQKIYLCEGEFVIPKSKRNLEYQVIGELTVEGLQTDSNESSASPDKEGTSCHEGKEQLSIPQDLADLIGDRKYAESERYVVWVLPYMKKEEYAKLDEEFFNSKNALYIPRKLNVWDKKTNKYFSVDAKTGSDASTKLGFVEDMLVISGLSINKIEGNRLECIYEQKSMVGGGFSISNHTIAFRPCFEIGTGASMTTAFSNFNRNSSQKHSIVVLDVHTLKEFDTGIVPDNHDYRPGFYRLVNNHLFYVRDNALYCFDIEKRIPERVIFRQTDLHGLAMSCHDGEVYIRYNNRRTKEGKLIGINLTNKQKIEYLDKLREYDDCHIVDRLGLLIIKTANGVYIFNMNSRKGKNFQLEHCENISIVGKYLYYRAYHDDFPTNRIDLSKINSSTPS